MRRSKSGRDRETRSDGGYCYETGCQNKVVGAQMRCQFHNDKISKRRLELEKSRSKAGRCPECGEPTHGTAKRCLAHSLKTFDESFMEKDTKGKIKVVDVVQAFYGNASKPRKLYHKHFKKD